ncbi:efflux RND transporter periplasmic adaptor subunit [Rouxiella badensis]|jgi:macrolide-specific efflux system membrane fusion protein|uniref:Efflux transporter periplasmic adaptor subunit n=2 Tax=Rouxiella badensis TaxID=1646377 RepID=A0A1X0WJ00_9GAMM|nr:efflux RND transporter periplasmic adaptor subunit [Rouxiella badensis]MCC3703642.1 efflux RND transporter periplasmic adaptor subunit [Rouxiella badensis]MCC3720496.1 efflux RND transporter periplasmic adaptor subunit [Rouxiella badensis]MCC3730335.1 efflux RND transporter periplasmic adaptor subunit [Rouxiella badensis]MCC3742214.1 efflux RND transporter periplasmic adaptor subunit [Rouxiella badensis]MCC3747537.1 efflux RND transporter periplasmic adaptor subunit [Rouxiella badensis]
MPPRLPPKKNIKYKKEIGVIILLLLLAFLFWGDGEAFTASPAPPLTVRVTRQTLELTVMASGILQPIKRIDVGSQASGQLKTLSVTPGDFVHQGQVLGEIDPTLSQNTLQDAEVALNSLLAQKRANQALVKRSALLLKRQQAMYTQSAASQQDVESAEADIAVQQAQLTSMNAQIHQQQIRVDTAKTNLGYTRIIAPVSGTVVSVNTQAGQTVVASYQIPVILQIADLSIMTVRAQIPEADISRVKPGLPVCFTTLGADTRPLCSTLRTLEPAPETINNAVFYNALFDVANPQGTLRPEMTALVSVVLQRADNVLTIPVTALGPQIDASHYRVNLMGTEGKTVARTILTGIDDGTRIEVKEGLQDGEALVIASLPPSETTK